MCATGYCPNKVQHGRIESKHSLTSGFTTEIASFMRTLATVRRRNVSYARKREENLLKGSAIGWFPLVLSYLPQCGSGDLALVC